VKALLAAVFCLCVAPAILPARAGTIAGATQNQQRGEQLNVTAGESRQLLVPGVTAAYAVDGAIAEASSRSGVVTVTGKSAGTTRIVVVTMDETRTIDLVVVARISAAPIGSANAKPPAATVETRYTSSTRQVTNVIDVAAGTDKRRTEVHLMNVRETGRDVYGARTSFPSASYAIITPRQRITFLDSAVDNSPLTLSRTNVRGFHLENDTWRVHAGYTGAAFYDGLVLPVGRELVFGASYIYRMSPVLRLMPSLYYYPSRNADGDRHGAVASLLADYGDDDALRARGEIGISRGLGGALQLGIHRGENRLRADVRYEPRRFAGAGPSDLHGFYSDASWSGRPSDRVTALVDISVNHYILPRFEQRSVTSNAEVRLRATKALSIIGGVNFGDFKAIVPSGASTRSLVIPAGFSLDFARGGLTALARFGDSSSSSATRGFRFSGRVSGGGFFATAYVDRLSEAPTLQLIYRERPDLALALEQLGLTTQSPQDIARLLRDNAALFNLGFIEGATVDLSLLRTQAGLEVAWLSNAPARHQLRLRLLHDRSERVALATTSDIATVSYSRRLTASIDVQASLSMWTTKSGSSASTRDRSVDLSVRKRFDEMPSLGSGAITGMVFSDEEMRGEPGAASNGIEGVEVQLDGGRSMITDARGHYAFSGISKGAHHIAAHLPAPASYFTTASKTEAAAGEAVDFGIANTPARLVGSVVSDARLGVGGIVVELTRGDRRITATTGQDGRFSIAAPPGEWRVAIDHDSLASLYVAASDSREIPLERGTPKTSNFAVTAIRSVAGRLSKRGVGSVEVAELGRRVSTDSEGNFVLRSMPAGEFTLVGRSGNASASAKVSLSREPVSVRDLVIVVGGR
jgi:SdrD B-like protein